jgi:hypothetical protein
MNMAGPPLLTATPNQQAHGWPFRAQPCRNFPTTKQQKNANMTNDKQACIDSISRVLERTAVWRKAIAVNFPDDSRNMRAAATLEKLAVDVANLTDEQWSALERYFSNGWNSEKWRSGLSQVARSVGFHNRATDFNFFAKVLVHQLSLTA